MAGEAGKGVDAHGGPVIDPTANVIALQHASAARQDDLRELNNRRIDAEIRLIGTRVSAVEREMQLRSEHHDRLQDVHATYEEKLRQAESARIDAIRQVDREEVAKTAAAANRAIETLATVTSNTAEALRNQVAAATQAQQNTHVVAMADVNKRLSSLELSSSEGRGKQTVADPMIAQLVAEVRDMKTTVTSTGGQTQGAKNLWAIIGGAILLFITIIGFMLMLFSKFGG
jgi:chromosome segregation ATPase